MGTIVAYFTNASERGVKVVGYIPTGQVKMLFIMYSNCRLPVPHLPNLRLVGEVFYDAVGISVVVLAVHLSLAKMVAKKLDYEVDQGQARRNSLKT